MIITQLTAFLLIVLLSHNIKYRRFTPMDFGFVFAVLYSLILMLIVYVDQIAETLGGGSISSV